MQAFIEQNLPNVFRTQAELIKSIWQTLEMTTISGLISAGFGIFFGVLLTVCKPEGISPNKLVYQLLDKLINVFRSIPFVILISLLMPLTRLITGCNRHKGNNIPYCRHCSILFKAGKRRP